ncbi:MAG: hypothetical protein A2X45_04840 [Lentisphaerae bacterium GWF2_50_93]|nr:MAG: hypothetical protein A2X45_04840 [Lentisphaerae bacterium GWF2_50_93]
MGQAEALSTIRIFAYKMHPYRLLSQRDEMEIGRGLQPLFSAVVVFACRRYAMSMSGLVVFTAYLWHA